MRGFVGAIRSVLGLSASPDRRRRPSEASLLQTLPEDEPILRFRLAAIFAAQLFDFATFTIMVERHGIRAELNPLVAAGYEAGGLPILLLAKLALVILVGATIVILGRRASAIHLPSRTAGVVTVIAVVAGLVGGFSNSISI